MPLTQFLIKSAVIAALILPGNWSADSSTAKVKFSVKGPFGTVHGSFSGLKADIRFDERSLGSSSISASIDVKTISTGIGLRNSDLRKKQEWFDADKYPTISFKSQKVEKTDGGYKAVGMLTMKGVTKPAEIPFTFTPSAGSGIFKGTFTVKREDYNLGKPGGKVGSDVTVSLEVPVKK